VAERTKRLPAVFAAASAMVFVSGLANAGGPIVLTDSQLDRVAAGDTSVFANANSLATGLIVAATTGTNTGVGSNQGVEEGFGSSGGVALGTAVAFTAGQATPAGCAALPSTCPSGSSTSANTGGSTAGNFTQTYTGGGTATAAGLTIQVSFTGVYGVFVPGL
jgi:hypothetical protein